jgi:Lsr2
VAQRVVLTDDLDGTEATQTITFTIDGQEYEIDLSDENVQRFHEASEQVVGTTFYHASIDGPAEPCTNGKGYTF